MSYHNPLTCLWRNWILPLFLSGKTHMDPAPKIESLTKEQLLVLLEFANENLEDFYAFTKEKRQTNRAKRFWADYTYENQVSCHQLTPLGIAIPFVMPIVAGVSIVVFVSRLLS